MVQSWKKPKVRAHGVSAVAFFFLTTFLLGADYYQISTYMVNLLSALGPVMYLLLMFFINLCIDRWGLRVTMIGNCMVMALGSGLRLLSNGSGSAFSPRGFAWAFLGVLLNAATGPFGGSAAPKLSAVWFSADERTTATGLYQCKVHRTHDSTCPIWLPN